MTTAKHSAGIRSIAKVLGIATLAAALLGGAAQAKEWTTVRIGTDATDPPFESVDSKGNIVGWEMEYADALCAQMKVTCTKQNQDWDGIIPSLLAGKYDVIVSGMNITPQRAQKVAFSKVYLATPPAFMTTMDNKSNDLSPAALKGKTIAAQSSTIFAGYLNKFYKDSEIKVYPGGDDPQMEVANGRVDYDLNDFTVLEDFIKKSGNNCCRIVSTIPRDPETMGPGAGAGFRKEDTELLAMFNKAIDALDADGTYKKLEAKYFKIDIRGTPTN
jgi:polar amino acid transport system substrate-binding protein